MTRMRSAITLAVAVISVASSASGHRVTVLIDGLRSDRGRAYVALHGSPAGFPGGAGAIRTGDARIVGAAASVTLDGIAPGTYAVAVVHDENGNGKLDSNAFGIPREGIGASNGAQGRFRAARFDDAKFTVAGDTVVSITIVYVDFF